MNYPFWETPVSYSLLMGLIAVFHVFISHFAIGGGLYLVISEMIARNKNDQQALQFLEKLTKFFVLITLVLGALSGVGIWFIIGLINPAATEVLIHNFVWAWAAEWTFFLMEISSAIIYFYGWKKMSAKNHIIVGWIYFIAAWMSLFIINGIITFMLTPGEWIQTGNFWDGFFNPTFGPSLVFRTGISVMLAGIYALIVASRYPRDEFKGRLVRTNAIWGLVGLALMVPAFYWYWEAIPAEVTTTALSAMRIPIESIADGYWYSGAAAFLLIVFGLILPQRHHMITAVLLMACGLMIFGKFEWFRESIRKPYVISQYMLGNAIEVANAKTYQSEGYLKHIAFRTSDDGKDLFNRACRSCHTMSGHLALKPIFDGTDKEFMANMIKGIRAMKGNMPPFYGTEKDIDLIADYIFKKTDRRPIDEIYGLEGLALGKKVYGIRCGPCHVMGGYNDKTTSLTGLGKEGYKELIEMFEMFAEEMPPFTGDDNERKALIEYLMTLGKE